MLIAAYRQGNKEKKMVAAQAVAVAANAAAEVARLSTFAANYPVVAVSRFFLSRVDVGP